jgi:hypothetical protein
LNPFFFFSRPWLATALIACALGAPAAQAQTIANSVPLSFGSFVAGVDGTVVVTPGSGRTSGGVMLVPQGPGSAAQFTFSGNAGTPYAITLPTDGMVMLTSGSNTMAVHSFSSSPASVSVPADHIVRGTLTGGMQILYVGATLTVGPAQPPGSYTGSFTVTVNHE